MRWNNPQIKHNRTIFAGVIKLPVVANTAGRRSFRLMNAIRAQRKKTAGAGASAIDRSSLRYAL